MKQLTFGASDDQAPVFSPDGTKIAFFSYRLKPVEIYEMSTDGTNQQRITHDEAFDHFPSWQTLRATPKLISYHLSPVAFAAARRGPSWVLTRGAGDTGGASTHEHRYRHHSAPQAQRRRQIAIRRPSAACGTAGAPQTVRQADPREPQTSTLQALPHAQGRLPLQRPHRHQHLPVHGSAEGAQDSPQAATCSWSLRTPCTRQDASGECASGSFLHPDDDCHFVRRSRGRIRVF